MNFWVIVLLVLIWGALLRLNATISDVGKVMRDKIKKDELSEPGWHSFHETVNRHL